MIYTIKVRGADRVAGDLDQMAEHARRVHKAFDKVADLLIKNEVDLWSKNGGSGKGRWQKNTKSTLASKIAKGLDKRPMRATGALERSLTKRGAPGQLLKIDDNSIEFGTTLFYAQFSQLAKNPNRKRLVVRLQNKAAAEIRETILAHITSGFGD